jgi:cytoskeletal protein RodZ
MKLFSGFRYAATFVFLVLLAAPAFAQFEVSPDHFDQPATTNKNTTSAKKPQNRTNQVHQAAGSTRKKRSVAGTGKPSPVTSAANSGATAANGTHPARRSKKSTVNSSATTPSLKAQASPVHHE